MSKTNVRILSGFLQSGFDFDFAITLVTFFGAVSIFPDKQFIWIGCKIMFFTEIISGLVVLFVRFRMNHKYGLQNKTEKSHLKKHLSNKDGRKRFFFSLIFLTGSCYTDYTLLG